MSENDSQHPDAPTPDDNGANAPDDAFFDDEENAPPGPRAFAQGVGIVLQTLGMLMFLSSCCICSLSGMWDPVLSRGQTHELIQSGEPLGISKQQMLEQPAKTGMMIQVMFGTVGGLALAGFGLGLQSEKMGAAYGAVGTAIALLLLLLLAGAGLLQGGAGAGAIGMNVVLVLVVLGLLALSIAALIQMRQFPPPPNLHVLPKDYPLPPDPFLKKKKRH